MRVIAMEAGEPKSHAISVCCITKDTFDHVIESIGCNLCSVHITIGFFKQPPLSTNLYSSKRIISSQHQPSYSCQHQYLVLIRSQAALSGCPQRRRNTTHNNRQALSTCIGNLNPQFSHLKIQKLQQRSI